MRHFDRLPLGVTGEHFGVFLVEHCGVDVGNGGRNFLLARPDVPQVHRFAVVTHTQRFATQVQAYTAGQCIGNYQWR
ncbi:hypothetical protein D3C85_1512890 [compost metagenome]